MIKPSVLDAMVAAGCSAEQIAAAVKADQASTSGAARQARYRERKASLVTSHNVTSVTVTDKVSPKKEIPPTPPKEKTTPSNFSSENAREFDQFWSLFPNKVGRRDAEKSFATALQRASFADIMAGLQRYVAKTDDRPWCNPTTFLNQDRWADQPAIAQPRPHSTASPPKPRNVGELSRDQLLSPRTEIDVTDYSAGRVDPSDRGRLSQSAGDAKPFAISGDILGRV